MAPPARAARPSVIERHVLAEQCRGTGKKACGPPWTVEETAPCFKRPRRMPVIDH
jgi:hypothetical protein